jgi:hypothetical protein
VHEVASDPDERHVAPRLQGGDLPPGGRDAGEVEVDHGKAGRLAAQIGQHRPPGSTASAWPHVSRPSAWGPPARAASTKAPVSMARARSSTSQWARPVGTVKAEGMKMRLTPSCP